MDKTVTTQPKKEIVNAKKQQVLVKKDWLTASVLALVVAILWIGLSVYKALNTTTVPAVQERRLTLFSTDVDDKVIGELGQKKHLIGQPVDENARVILILPGETIETSSTQ